MAKIKSEKLRSETRSFQFTVGGVSVKCYAGRDGRWFVTYAIAGKRRTEAFRLKEAARNRAAEIAGAVHNQQANAKTLTGKDLQGSLRTEAQRWRCFAHCIYEGMRNQNSRWESISRVWEPGSVSLNSVGAAPSSMHRAAG